MQSHQLDIAAREDDIRIITPEDDPLIMLGVRLQEARGGYVFLTILGLASTAVALMFIALFNWENPPHPPDWLIATGHTLWLPTCAIAVLAVFYGLLRVKGQHNVLLRELAAKEEEIKQLRRLHSKPKQPA